MPAIVKPALGLYLRRLSLPLGGALLMSACGGSQLPTPKATLNDTGITVCMNESWQAGSCNEADDTLMAAQDAAHGRDAQALVKVGGGAAGFDFTKLDTAGKALANQKLSYAEQPWACVQDNHTGLIWEVKSPDANSPSYFNNTYSWYDSQLSAAAAGMPDGGNCIVSGGDNANATCDTASFIAIANTQARCGQLQWGLPSVTELLSIADQSTSNPPLDTNYFPNSSLNAHWSKQGAAFKPDFAWYVYLTAAGNGLIAKNGVAHIRLVSVGQNNAGDDNAPVTATHCDTQAMTSAAGPLTVQSNTALVKDEHTQLTWMRCPVGFTFNAAGECDKSDATIEYTWQSALAASQAEYYGLTQWRLPNKKELASIIDYRCAAPAYNSEAFPIVDTNTFWSSTPLIYFDQPTAWAINFEGGDFLSVGAAKKYAVRLVRGD